MSTAQCPGEPAARSVGVVTVPAHLDPALACRGIPPKLEDLTPEWMTHALRLGGVLTHARVTRLDVVRIGIGVGFLDGVGRVRLAYDRPESGAPDSVVVKLPSPDPANRRVADDWHAYEREVRFYAEVAPRSPVRVPRCYFAVMDRGGNQCILVFEDLGAWEAGNQPRGLTPEQARAAVEAIGPFHARWWESADLASLPWIPATCLKGTVYREHWPLFLAQEAHRLSPEAIAVGEQVGRQFEALVQRVESGPRTLVHFDFRADNLLFDASAAPSRAVVLDWQLTVRARGAFDVARLLCGSLPVADRDRDEVELVRRWHALLLAGGVREYSLDQALCDYRTSALVCLYFIIVFHDIGEAAGERGHALVLAMVERYFSAAVQPEFRAVLAAC